MRFDLPKNNHAGGCGHQIIATIFKVINFRLFRENMVCGQKSEVSPGLLTYLRWKIKENVQCSATQSRLWSTISLPGCFYKTTELFLSPCTHNNLRPWACVTFACKFCTNQFPYFVQFQWFSIWIDFSKKVYNCAARRAVSHDLRHLFAVISHDETVSNGPM